MIAENQNTETVPANPNASARIEVANPPGTTQRNRYTVIGIAVTVLAAGLAIGILPRLKAQTKLATEARATDHQTVTVTNVTRPSGAVQLALPGDVRAFEETRLYARADGYLLKWEKDIGAKVEAGQVLAVIDTPELDQQLNQGRAALSQAVANLTLARKNAERWQALLKDRAVSEQEVDERNSALAARDADVQAAQANVSRLEKLSSFKTVRAPFAGTLTRRYVDTGALIRTASGTPLFELAQTEKLRVQINLPQAYLRDIAIGSPVNVTVAEYPGRSFHGNVMRTSGAFDSATRTMLTEIEVPNPSGELYPGIHVDVQLSLAQANPPIVIPATAVIVRSEGSSVAQVDDANTIRLEKVQLGRDLGKAVEVLAGLNDGARIVTNPTDKLVDGTPVRLAGASLSAAAFGQQPAQLAKH
jgi:RND family efflux transporter MFP subunit